MANRDGRFSYKDVQSGDEIQSLRQEIRLLRNQLHELKSSHEDLKKVHSKNTRSLKAALKASHAELKTSTTDLKSSVEHDVNLLQRMALELHTMFQRNATSSPTPTIDEFRDSQRNNFADALGPVPSHAEQRVQQLEVLLQPIVTDLLIANDTLKESPWEDEPVPEEPRFLNLANFAGDEGDDVELETDMYSVFIISRTWSVGFFYPLLIALTQFFITSLILVDLTSDDDRPFGVKDDNVTNVPPKISPQVACAQFISLIIAFVTVDDVITSLKMFLNGYDPGIESQNPGSSYCKYIAANSIRFLVGLCTIFVSVILIIQSSSVIDIFMNFAAVAFVSELDNIAFGLAEIGLCGETLKAACEMVRQTKVKVQAKSQSLGYAVNALFVLLFLPFLGILLTNRIKQANGYLLENVSCDNLEVQFGDEVLEFSPGVRFTFEGEGINKAFPDSKRRVPFLDERPKELLYQYFSAVYVAEEEENADRLKEVNSRPVYYERGIRDPTSGKFYYCDRVKSWVFTIEALYNTPGAIPEEAREECEWGWLMQSPVTTAITLEEAPITGWNVWTGSMEEVSSTFRIRCTDCERNSDCGLTHGTCDLGSGTCICNDEWQGRSCNQEKPYCPGLIFLHYGESSHDYEEFSPFHLAIDFATNATVLAYQRPVYVAEIYHEGFPIAMANVYTGRRWFITAWTYEDLKLLADIEVHAFWDDILDRNTFYYSEPTENYLPTGLKWYQKRESSSKGNFAPFGASFEINGGYECLDFDCMEDDTICGLHGSCIEGIQVIRTYDIFNNLINTSFPRNYCECSNNYGGYFCEYAPEGPYSIEMYQQYIVDPDSYYQNNSELQYLKYWVNHTIGTEIGSMKNGTSEENRSEREGEL